MEFNIQVALEMVEESTVEELGNLTKEDLLAIMGALGPVDFQEFLFAKNIKIFGGINGYIDDYFSKNTVNKVKTLSNSTKSSTVIMLKKMLTYDAISEANKKRVTAAISELKPTAAAAAAGSKKLRKGRRSRSRKIRN
jgi:hypothetical protein